MNKNRLMASGALLAIGAMFPLTAGALSSATASPEPVVSTTASPSASASITANPLPDCANLKPGDAWAGVSLHCNLGSPSPAPTAAPTASVAPGTVPAPAQTAPTCPAGTLMAEDWSCVNEHFWDAPHQCQEDEPCWDCLHDGNKLCGVEPAKLEDAWASFDAEKVAGVVGKSIAFDATYIGTSGASSIPGYWVVPSLKQPNTFHVFLVHAGS